MSEASGHGCRPGNICCLWGSHWSATTTQDMVNQDVVSHAGIATCSQPAWTSLPCAPKYGIDLGAWVRFLIEQGVSAKEAEMLLILGNIDH